MSQAIIELKNVSKKFDGDDVLNNISFTINRHEFVTLLGPSGCGKTTTLRIIGGFETPSEGEVLFEGKDLLALPSHKRSINTVFQKYALFPHMNVYDNIAFGLKVKKTEKSIIRGKVEEALKLVNLSGYERRDVEALSGGQQQRVAIARAIVNEPKVLLLDEPLGALDLKLRKEMQIELKRMQQRLGITFIYVTHDQEEALTMSDRIVVMNKGQIQQIGSPEDIYNEPQNAFVAGFIGDSNILDGVMLDDFRVVFLGHEFECVDKGFGKNETVDVVLRPEDVKLKPQNEGMIQGLVKSAIFKGVHYEMVVETEGTSLIVHSTHLREPGTPVGISVVPFDIQIMKKVAP